MPTTETTLYIGAFPDTLPLEFPLHEGDSIVGSRVHLFGSGTIYGDMFLEAGSDAINYYRDALPPLGWVDVTDDIPTHCVSAIPANCTWLARRFCDDTTGLYISITTDSAVPYPAPVHIWMDNIRRECGVGTTAQIAVPKSHHPGSVRVVGGDTAGLLRLFGWLQSSYRAHYDVSITPGDLPPDPPLPLFLPEASRVIGSHVLEQRFTYFAGIFAESSLSPEEDFAFYADTLTEPDWRRLNENTYCYFDDRAYFQVRHDNLGALYLVVRAGNLSPCPDNRSG